jgi:hypothetical protein
VPAKMGGPFGSSFFGLSFKGKLKLESNHSVATQNLSSGLICVWLSWVLTGIFILYDSLNLNSGAPLHW